MTVFIVTRANGSSNLLGVYSTKEKAIEAIEANGGFDSKDGFNIEEASIN